MTDYLHKIRSKVCHAYRVNPLEESVDGATIAGVPFCGLKRIGIKTMER